MDLRKKIYKIIFEHDTPAGKWFDILLIISILLSVALVMLDSVQSFTARHGDLLYFSEWFFTLLFTCEYMLRLYSIDKPLRYAVSFFGIVDLVAIVPTYLSLLVPGTQFLLVVRVLRVLRIFRILKFAQYVKESNILLLSLLKSRRKIAIFLFSLVNIAIIMGSLMYVIETGEDSGFTSIPVSVYWAIVTLTTVGYGDISPQNPLGQFFASILMILGYSIIAVPTGIVTSEMSRIKSKDASAVVCKSCGGEGHEEDASYCKFCGGAI